MKLGTARLILVAGTTANLVIGIVNTSVLNLLVAAVCAATLVLSVFSERRIRITELYNADAYEDMMAKQLPPVRWAAEYAATNYRQDGSKIVGTPPVAVLIYAMCSGREDQDAQLLYRTIDDTAKHMGIRRKK